MARKRRGEQQEQAPQDIRGKLLLVQSEYMFANRDAFIYEVLLPFLHPLQQSNSTPYHKSKGINYARNSYIVDRRGDTSTQQQVQNQKKIKHESAQLSHEMAKRLLDFYATIPIEVLLLGLQRGERARVVPPLHTEARELNWWGRDWPGREAPS